MNWYTAFNNGCFNLPCYSIAHHVLEIHPTLWKVNIRSQYHKKRRYMYLFLALIEIVITNIMFMSQTGQI